MMFDTHLINEALIALGITVGIAILMALAITGIAASQLRQRSPRSGKLAAVPTQTVTAQPASEREPQAA
jgi:hypothetical protein